MAENKELTKTEKTLEEEYEEIEKALAEGRADGTIPPDYGDWVENPRDNVSARQRELCRLIARGLKNKDVCIRLGYSPAWVSTLLRNPKIRELILKFQDRAFDTELDTRFKEIAPDAMDVIERSLSPQSTLKEKDKIEVSKWILEKETGKASQKVEVESASLGRLLDRLDKQDGQLMAKEVGMKDQGEVIDAEFEESDPIESWFEKEIDAD